MKKEKTEEYLKEFSRYLEVEKCIECECLQGALVQLKLDWPELAEEVDRLISKEFHSCLGCEPCPPAELWTEYLKEKEAGI